MRIELLVLMGRMMPDEINTTSETALAMLDQDVIDLHNIARRIENLIGQGALSNDLRFVADRLHTVLKRH
jgi:hypothetical protein